MNSGFAYVGRPGSCTCGEGFSGSASYNNGQPTGCRLCSGVMGMFANPGVQAGYAITGHHPWTSSCTCATGYTGTVSWDNNGRPTGCTRT